MIVIDPSLLKKVQAVELDILKTVDALCKKHKLTYYMIGGTLLGAVRHRGFIPWDDDIDIAMLRADYDRFCALWALDPPTGLYLQNPEREPGFWHFISKIRKDGTLFDDEMTAASGRHCGVYIDLFPLDNIPARDSLWQRIKYVVLRAALSAMLYKNGFRGYKNPLIGAAARLLSPLPTALVMRAANAVMRAYNGRETGLVTSYMSHYGYRRQRMSKAIYAKPVPLRFEDGAFPAPRRYKDYLRRLFGDYKRLPPPEKRRTHHARLRVELPGCRCTAAGKTKP